MRTSKTVEEYMALPYSIEVTPQVEDDGTTYFARVIELPGCMTEVDSFEEVEEMIRDAMQGWLEVAMEIGKKIPEPKVVEQYSGKFVLRLPKSLHRDAARAADRDAVSLNQYIVTLLSKELGNASVATSHRGNYMPVFNPEQLLKSLEEHNSITVSYER